MCLILIGFALITALKVPETTPVKNEPEFICGNTFLSMKQELLEDMDGYKLFSRNCTSCHSLYKNIIGPELGTVAGRRDSLWITQWVWDSEALRKKDDVAQNMYLEYNKIPCVKHNHFTKEDMSDLMTFLQEQNKVSK